jgi:hypothetical protein
VAIIVAKDHEKTNFEALLKKNGIIIKPIEANGKHQSYLGEFTLHPIEIGDGNPLKCVVTYMNGQGEGIVKFVEEFLDIVKVKNLMTVGVCGGAEDHLTEVMFFDEAWLMDAKPRPRKINIGDYARFGDDETWRKNGEKFQILKPREFHVVLTGKSIEENVADALKKFNDNLPDAVKAERSACACDMEIGYIFETIDRRNDIVVSENQVHLLHAIKAVSDVGKKGQRDDNKITAMENAARALILYLRLLAKQKIIHRFPDPVAPQPDQGGPEEHGVANGPQTPEEKAAMNHLTGTLADELNTRLKNHAKQIFTRCGYMNDWDTVHHQYPGREIAILLTEQIPNSKGKPDFKKFYEVIVTLEQRVSIDLINHSPSKILFH